MREYSVMVDGSYTCDSQTVLLLIDRHLTVDICKIQTYLFDAVRNSLVGRRFVAQSTLVVWLPCHLRQAVVADNSFAETSVNSLVQCRSSEHYGGVRYEVNSTRQNHR